jgi:hypothetical protein
MLNDLEAGRDIFQHITLVQLLDVECLRMDLRGVGGDLDQAFWMGRRRNAGWGRRF